MEWLSQDAISTVMASWFAAFYVKRSLFNSGVVNRIRNLPRPLIVHFIQVMSNNSTSGNGNSNKSPQSQNLTQGQQK